jgi:hypothetical protein
MRILLIIPLFLLLNNCGVTTLVSSFTAEKIATKVISGQVIKKQTGFTPLGHTLNLLKPKKISYYDER